MARETITKGKPAGKVATRAGVGATKLAPVHTMEARKEEEAETGTAVMELEPDMVEFLLPMVEERQALSETIAALEEEKRSLNQQILDYTTTTGIKTAKVGEWMVIRKKNVSAVLSKELLLKKGVKAGVIEECVVRKETMCIMVTKAKDGGA